MAYIQAVTGKTGTRYRAFYQDTDGRYKSAGRFESSEKALEVAEKDTLRLHVIPFIGKARIAEMNRTAARNFFTALEEAGRSPNTIRQAKIVLAAMFTMAVGEGYLDVNPFHDVKTPKVGGPRPIKIATTGQYVKVRACLPTRPAKVFSTLKVASGARFCGAIAFRSIDLDFETGLLQIARSVVKVSREHHPQGKTFLIRNYTKDGLWRQLMLDRGTVEMVHKYVEEYGIGPTELMFPIELVVPPRATKPALTAEEIEVLGTSGMPLSVLPGRPSPVYLRWDQR